MRPSSREGRWRLRVAIVVLAGCFGAVAILVLNSGLPTVRAVFAARTAVSDTLPGELVACRNGLRRSALLAVAQVENGMRSGRADTMDADMDRAEDALREALACAPAQPTLWLAVARLRAIRHGIDETVARYVEMSCRTGRFELWNARDRIRFFGAAEADLSEDARRCLAEDRASFARLIASR